MNEEEQRNDEYLNEAIEALAAANKRLEAEEKTIRDLRSIIQAILKAKGQKSYKRQVGDKVYTTTLVRTVNVAIDTDSIIKDNVLTDEELQSVIPKKIDRKLLEKAVDNDVIPAGKIASYVTSKESYSVRFQSGEAELPDQ